MTPQVKPTPNVQHAGTTISWQGRLDGAQGPDEVVAIARDFLARISAEEYSGLPEDCRPHKLVDADDVVDYAMTLVLRSCASDSLADAVLEQVATFFTDAAGALSRLAVRPAEGETPQ